MASVTSGKCHCRIAIGFCLGILIGLSCGVRQSGMGLRGGGWAQPRSRCPVLHMDWFGRVDRPGFLHGYKKFINPESE